MTYNQQGPGPEPSDQMQSGFNGPPRPPEEGPPQTWGQQSVAPPQQSGPVPPSYGAGSAQPPQQGQPYPQGQMPPSQGQPYPQGQMPQGPPPYMQQPAPARRGGSVGGVILVVIGALVMLIGLPLGGIIGGALAASNAASALTDMYPVSPIGTVEYQSGDAVDLFAVGTGTGVQPICTVNGPDGALVEVDPPSSDDDLTAGDLTYSPLGSFEAPETGDYQFSCNNTGATMAYASTSGTGSSLLAPFFWGLGIGALVSLLGVAMLIMGIVSLVKARKAARAGM